MAYHLTVRTFLMPDLNHPIRRGKRTFHPFEISQMWDCLLYTSIGLWKPPGVCPQENRGRSLIHPMVPRAGENTYILLRLLTKHLYCFSKLRDYRLQIGIIESNNNRRIILYPICISDVRRHESEIRFTRRGMKPKLKKAIAHTLLA